MCGLGFPSRRRRFLVRRGQAIAIGCAVAVFGASCGQGEEPGLGAGVPTPSTVITTTTSTIPTTTSSTIDFSRPITQGSAPLAEEAGLDEVAALVADIRGQSADVSAQVERLAPFPDLGLTPVAQITDIEVSLSPEEDGLHPSTVTLRFRVPGTEVDLTDRIIDRFDALAWYQTDQTTTESTGGTITESIFRIPGFDPDEAEFRSAVTLGAAGGATLVELTSVARSKSEDVVDAEDLTYYERLSVWQDSLALTRVADLDEVGVTTREDSGSVFARYTIEADDEADAVADLALASARGDYEILGATADEPPTSGPLRLVDESGNLVIVDLSPGPSAETFVVEASHGFELTPLD